MMKKIFGLMLLAMTLFLGACNGDEATVFDNRENTETLPAQPGVHFRDILASCEGKTPQVTIDREQKQISVRFTDWVDLSNVLFSIKITQEATLVVPNKQVVTLDVTKPIEIILEEQGEKVTYSLIATCPKPVDPTDQGWKSKEYATLPDYVKVYTSPDMLEGKAVKAYIVKVDMKKGAEFDVLGKAEGLQTPTQFYEADEKPAIVMNAGFFTWNATQKKNLSTCIIVRDGKTLCVNSQTVTRDKKTFYPTRSAFGIDASGSMKIDWIYSTDINTTYAYPELAMNNLTGTPLERPSASFPERAKLWQPQIAIGAGPTLVKNNVIRNHYNEELFDGISPTSNRARSAIGITFDGNLLFFVCEEKSTVDGVTLMDVAKIMNSLGCKDAMNLDGGGSSCLLVNGTETIKPSDTNGQRPVSTVLVVR